jgi:BlaR1 peptidase M56
MSATTVLLNADIVRTVGWVLCHFVWQGTGISAATWAVLVVLRRADPQLRPIILLPASAVFGLSPDDLESILLHELAHIGRHDHLMNALQSMAEWLLFFHPAVWWVSAQLRVEREFCCDDCVISLECRRATYGRALARLEGLRLPVPAVAVAATDEDLLRRIRRLARPDAAAGASPESAQPVHVLRETWVPSVRLRASVRLRTDGTWALDVSAPAPVDSSWQHTGDTFAQLSRRLTEAAVAAAGRRLIVITADSSVAHRDVTRVMDLGRSAGSVDQIIAVDPVIVDDKAPADGAEKRDYGGPLRNDPQPLLACTSTN